MVVVYGLLGVVCFNSVGYFLAIWFGCKVFLIIFIAMDLVFEVCSLFGCWVCGCYCGLFI